VGAVDGRDRVELDGREPPDHRLDIVFTGAPEPRRVSLRPDDQAPDRREAYRHCSTFEPEMVEDGVDKLLRRYPESPIIEDLLGTLDAGEIRAHVHELEPETAEIFFFTASNHRI
jgi:hypothetical protein